MSGPPTSAPAVWARTCLLAAGAFAIAYAVSSPLLAALTGRWERRTLLVVARVVSALGAAACTPAATLVATVLTPPPTGACWWSSA